MPNYAFVQATTACYNSKFLSEFVVLIFVGPLLLKNVLSYFFFCSMFLFLKEGCCECVPVFSSSSCSVRVLFALHWLSSKLLPEAGSRSRSSPVSACKALRTFIFVRVLFFSP